MLSASNPGPYGDTCAEQRHSPILCRIHNTSHPPYWPGCPPKTRQDKTPVAEENNNNPTALRNLSPTWCNVPRRSLASDWPECVVVCRQPSSQRILILSSSLPRECVVPDGRLFLAGGGRIRNGRDTPPYFSASSNDHLVFFFSFLLSFLVITVHCGREYRTYLSPRDKSCCCLECTTTTTTTTTSPPRPHPSHQHTHLISPKVRLHSSTPPLLHPSLPTSLPSSARPPHSIGGASSRKTSNFLSNHSKLHS